MDGFRYGILNDSSVVQHCGSNTWQEEVNNDASTSLVLNFKYVFRVLLLDLARLLISKTELHVSNSGYRNVDDVSIATQLDTRQ